jgi:hypothetical protein
MMMSTILFDKTAYVDRLRRAGIAEDQARAHAEAMDEALREAVSTKADITTVRMDIAALRSEIQLAVRDMTIRTGTMLSIAVGILIAVKFFG